MYNRNVCQILQTRSLNGKVWNIQELGVFKFWVSLARYDIVIYHMIPIWTIIVHKIFERLFVAILMNCKVKNMQQLGFKGFEMYLWIY